MIKLSYFHRISLMIASVYLLGFTHYCSAANETRVVFPPLQFFKDFCVDGGWSLDEASRLAEQHNLALISSEDVSVPDGGPAHKNIWQAETAVGRIGLIVIDGISGSHGHTFTCGVTAPSYSTAFIQSWCRGSFGDPTLTLNKPPDALEIHWTHLFEDGKVDVILLTRVPNDNSALLTVMKHRDKAAGSDIYR